MTTGRISKSFGVFNIYSTRSLDCAMFWLRKICSIPFFSPMNIWNFKKSKNQQKNQIFIGTKKSVDPNFRSQNIAQSRYLEEYVFKTPKLFEIRPVVIDFFWKKNPKIVIFVFFQNFEDFRRKIQKIENFPFSFFFPKKIDDYWSVFKMFWCFKYVLFEITRLRYVLASKILFYTFFSLRWMFDFFGFFDFLKFRIFIWEKKDMQQNFRSQNIAQSRDLVE